MAHPWLVTAHSGEWGGRHRGGSADIGKPLTFSGVNGRAWLFAAIVRPSGQISVVISGCKRLLPSGNHRPFLGSRVPLYIVRPSAFLGNGETFGLFGHRETFGSFGLCETFALLGHRETFCFRGLLRDFGDFWGLRDFGRTI